MKIIVNGTTREWHWSTLTYEDVLELIGAPSRAILTVTFKSPGKQGTLSPPISDDSPGTVIEVVEGLIVNAVGTGNA